MNMKELKKVSTTEEMQTWLSKLKNATIILPAGEWTWWQCPHCFHQGYHTGYHYRTMLRKPIEIDGNLATVLRDLVVENDNDELEDMNALVSNLHKIWQSNKEDSDFETWKDFYMKPWQMVKATCLILKEKDNGK